MRTRARDPAARRCRLSTDRSPQQTVSLCALLSLEVEVAGRALQRIFSVHVARMGCAAVVGLSLMSITRYYDTRNRSTVVLPVVCDFDYRAYYRQ